MKANLYRMRRLVQEDKRTILLMNPSLKKLFDKKVRKELRHYKRNRVEIEHIQ